jgi:transposase
MSRRKRRTFTDEFRADVVRVCQEGGRTIAEIAREFDLTDGSVRQWVKRADADANPQGTGVLTSAEREEVSEMRRRLRRLERENEFLKKAAAFFASETR